MIDIGIQDGDMVLVRKQEEAHPGDIVVAYMEGMGFVSGSDFEKIQSARLLNSSEYTYNEQLGFISLSQPVLHPENKKMADIPAMDCRIQGVAVWVFKKVS